MKSITIQVILNWHGQRRVITLQHSIDQPLSTLLTIVGEQLGTPLSADKWSAQHQGTSLSWDRPLAEEVLRSTSLSFLVIELVEAPDPSVSYRALNAPPAPPAVPAAEPPFPADAASPPMEDDDIDLVREASAGAAYVPEPAAFESSPPLTTKRAESPQRSKAEAETLIAPAPAQPERRQSTVRYYHRMNPMRLFPLLVVIAKEKIKDVRKRRVSQVTSEQFEVKEQAPVIIEPVLPGCDCYPPQLETSVSDDVTLTFWVVPHVLGRLRDTRVAIRQEGKVLTEVPLQMRVSKQTWTIVAGVLAVLLPFLSTLLQRYKLDFESQLEKGFPLYAQVGHFLFRSTPPELLGGVLLFLTLGLYLWHRPRRRDVFWDVDPLAG